MSLWPARFPRWRGASLFQRLLMAQLGLAMGLAVVIGLLFYVERNITVATLFADLWAPRLASAAGLPIHTNDDLLQIPGPTQVQVKDQAPEGTRRTSLLAPRFVALRQVLRGHGLAVAEIRLELGRHEPRIWLEVERPAATSLWLGVSGRMVAPEWSRRALLALVLCGALVVGLSWWLARRLARPLEQLKLRLQAQQPGAAALPQTSPLRNAPPEVAAIDAAYSELLARWQRHERERALLLAGVSHDLRSPLGRIRMATELMPDDPTLNKRKATVVRNVGEADRLIESFLDFVRSGELPCEDIVDIADAARVVVQSFERPEAQLSLEAPAQLWLPRANRLLVERLIANLVDNALKHGRPPVQVVLSAPSEGGVRLVVEDAGDGLDPHQLEALQEAFRRGDSARTQAGSGLGLAIVRQVSARLGGRIGFERAGGRQQVVVTWPQGGTEVGSEAGM